MQADFTESLPIFEDNGILDIIREVIGDDSKYRAFLDYYIHKIPLKRLAEQRGITVNAMKMRLYRFKKLCYIALKERRN